MERDLARGKDGDKKKDVMFSDSELEAKLARMGMKDARGRDLASPLPGRRHVKEPEPVPTAMSRGFGFTCLSGHGKECPTCGFCPTCLTMIAPEQTVNIGLETEVLMQRARVANQKLDKKVREKWAHEVALKEEEIRSIKHGREREMAEQKRFFETELRTQRAQWDLEKTRLLTNIREEEGIRGNLESSQSKDIHSLVFELRTARDSEARM